VLFKENAVDPITYNGTSYQPHPLTVDQAETAFEQFKGEGRKLNRAIVAGSFSLTDEQVSALEWPLYQQLVEAALDVNEMRPKGEATAAGA